MEKSFLAGGLAALLLAATAAAAADAPKAPKAPAAPAPQAAAPHQGAQPIRLRIGGAQRAQMDEIDVDSHK
jgi:Spy/CpxP family protein refolding chaperone